MFCLDISQKKWIDVKSIDLGRRNVLGRNFYVSIPQDLGVEPAKGYGIGRIAETHISGESVIGKIGLYEIDLRSPVCKLCPAELESVFELRETWVSRPEIALLHELGIAYRVVREIVGSVLVLGESVSSLAMALVAERFGALVYTLRRKIPSVKTHQLTIETWDELRARNIFIGGNLSDEEKLFIEEKLSHARKAVIYYHPLMRGSKIALSLGEHLVLKRPRKPLVSPRLLPLASKLFRLAHDKYIYVVRPGENLPEKMYVVIDFRASPKSEEISSEK